MIGLLVMALLLISAVGLGQAKTQIELWFPPGNQIAENMQPTIERFNAAHPDIEAVIVHRDPAPAAVLTAVAGDVAPNVIFGAHSWSPTYAANNILVNLWPYIIRDGLEAEYRQDFFPGALVTGNTYRGQLIGLPMLLQIEALYYQPEIFDRSGIAVPDEGWTWDDLAQMAQRMTRIDADGTVSTYGAASSTAQNMAILFLMQHGATIWDEETYRSTVNQPEFREGIEQLYDLAQRNVIYLGQNVHVNSNDIREAFLNANVGIFQDGTYRLPAIEEQNPDVRVLPLPSRSPDAEPVTMLTLRNINILRSRDAAKEEASWRFVKWLMEPENLAQTSVDISALGGRPSLIQQPVYAEYIARSPHLTAFASMLAPYSTGVGFTGIPGRDEVFNKGFTPLTVQALRGELPVPAYIDQLHQVVDQILAEYR